MLNISIDTKDDIEKFLLIANIGMMVALGKDLITIENAEKYLYSPYSVIKIRNLGINEEVIKLVESGCELEDVESLIPNKLNTAINDIYDKSIALLSALTDTTIHSKKWID